MRGADAQLPHSDKGMQGVFNQCKGYRVRLGGK